MSNQNRKHILLRLIRLDGDLGLINNELKSFSWDVEEPIVILTMVEVRDVLRQYLNGKKTIEDLEKWADLIECRDDIGFDAPSADTIKTIINKLANPEINGRINIETINNWLQDQK